MANRRKSGDYDWERELAARARGSLKLSAEDELETGHLRSRKVLSQVLGFGLAVFAVGGSVIKLLDPHAPGALHVITLVGAASVFVLTGASFVKRFRKWRDGDPIAATGKPMG
jgi:hypothetical protein